MPTKKETKVVKSAQKKPKTTKAKKTLAKEKGTNICSTCNVLPVGSAEVISLLLVLVFSLVSVLFTAILTLDARNTEVLELQTKQISQK